MDVDYKAKPCKVINSHIFSLLCPINYEDIVSKKNEKNYEDLN